jgi:hypothetical protein
MTQVTGDMAVDSFSNLRAAGSFNSSSRHVDGTRRIRSRGFSQRGLDADMWTFSPTLLTTPVHISNGFHWLVLRSLVLSWNETVVQSDFRIQIKMSTSLIRLDW